MTTTAPAATNYGELRSELARYIREHRPTCPPQETARQLLEYDQPGITHLVGLDREREHAILYHEQDLTLAAFPFGPNGLAVGGQEIGKFARVRSLSSWIDRNPREWGWINPRFR